MEDDGFIFSPSGFSVRAKSNSLGGEDECAATAKACPVPATPSGEVTSKNYTSTASELRRKLTKMGQYLREKEVRAKEVVQLMNESNHPLLTEMYVGTLQQSSIHHKIFLLEQKKISDEYALHDSHVNFCTRMSELTILSGADEEPLGKSPANTQAESSRGRRGFSAQRIFLNAHCFEF